MAASERLDEASRVCLSLHGDGGELQPGNPAFRAGLQRGDVCLGEVQPHHLIEKLGGFGRGKTQVGEA